jgi:hypothetical protein
MKGFREALALLDFSASLPLWLRRSAGFGFGH